MPTFRADFDVRGTLVLRDGSPTLNLRNDDPPFEIILRNAKPDTGGHVPGLDIRVIGPCDSIDDVPTSFREVLAKQLDILTFVTHSSFVIDQCRRVIEWEPFQKRRMIKVMQKFDPLYPPDPEFPSECIDTAQAIVQANPPPYVLRALRCFRVGVRLEQPEEQFPQFWLALETIAEGHKDRARTPIKCPKCQGPLQCKQCEETPTRRPMAQQAIRDLVAKVMPGHQPDQCYRRLTDTRNHLMHGRTKRSIEDETGRSLDDLVNEVAYVAWNSILLAIPNLQGALQFAHRDGDFAHRFLVAGPVLTFDHTGVDEHPPDEAIPEVKVELLTRFDVPPKG
ncbi:MAG: hypothetical protein WDN25_13715 [Acetobacteraceae bacterium]